MAFRIITYTRREPEDHGYVGTKSVTYQELQEGEGKKWRTLGREEVPEHALISLGAYGDTGGWVSKFSDLFAWGRDGVCTAR